MDYLIQNLWLLWTLVCIVALIIEVTTGTFYVMCLAIGAVVAVVLSLFPVPLWVQVLAFAAASALSVLCVRPALVRWLHAKADERASNADALIGRIGVVIEPIAPGHPGYVRIDGDEWRAVCNDPRPVERGVKVEVTAMESIVVTVKPV